MKILCVFFILLLSFSNSYGADVNVGLEAYSMGDFATALKEWQPLAESGDASAQSNMGVLFDRGEGVLLDDEQAVYWYTKAAEQGFAVAQYNLGIMYYKGEGIQQDFRDAVYWYTKAAEQGEVQAQSDLGYMHINGLGVLQDFIIGYAWSNVAASQGDVVARKNRDIYIDRMTNEHISKGQDLSREIYQKIYGEKERNLH